MSFNTVSKRYQGTGILKSDCKQPLRIGIIRALNECTGRLFRATTRHKRQYKAQVLQQDIGSLFFKHPANIFLSGPSGSGKTEFVKKMIEYRDFNDATSKPHGHLMIDLKHTKFLEIKNMYFSKLVYEIRSSRSSRVFSTSIKRGCLVRN